MATIEAKVDGSNPLIRKRARMAARPFKAPSKATYSGRVAIRFRAMRTKAGWNVEQMWREMDAAGIEVTVSAIRSWENGSRAIDPNYYPAIAKIFGCANVHEFLPAK